MNTAKVIEKALAKTTGMPDAQRAAVIADYLEIAQELSAEAPANVGYRTPIASVEQTVTVTPSLTSHTTPQGLIILPGEAEMVPPPRMGSTAPKSSVVNSVDEIKTILTQHAPPSLDVKLQDGKLLRLTRTIQAIPMEAQGEPGSGMVKLTYSVEGEDGAPVYVFTTDKQLNLSASMLELIDSAKSRYGRGPRAPIKPRPAKTFAFDIEETMRNSSGGEADEAGGNLNQALERFDEGRTSIERQQINNYFTTK